MDKNDLAVGIANIVNEGETSTKELLTLVNPDVLNQLYDWLDEHLVERNEENESDEEELESEEEDEDSE